MAFNPMLGIKRPAAGQGASGGGARSHNETPSSVSKLTDARSGTNADAAAVASPAAAAEQSVRSTVLHMDDAAAARALIASLIVVTLSQATTYVSQEAAALSQHQATINLQHVTGSQLFVLAARQALLRATCRCRRARGMDPLAKEQVTITVLQVARQRRVSVSSRAATMGMHATSAAGKLAVRRAPSKTIVPAAEDAGMELPSLASVRNTASRRSITVASAPTNFRAVPVRFQHSARSVPH
ncbi:hypothetical protein EON67_03930 [archaeon]|nr:MAG: hypothetical protein EON67_03930 [archaeon]